MKFYTIENETNNITVHTSAKEAQAVPDAQRFTTETTFARLAAEWPTSRFIAIWNTLPGVIPVRKFASRKLAVTRIWNTVRTLGEETVARAAEPKEAGERSVQQTSAAATGAAPARRAARKKAEKTSGALSRKDTILALVGRPQGADLNELMEATGWQAHSVRGFLSGVLRKKLNLNVVSADGNGVRKYRIGA